MNLHYLISSKHFAAGIKSSIGISSGGIFSSFFTFFFRRSFTISSRRGSTFFFFFGSALFRVRTEAELELQPKADFYFYKQHFTDLRGTDVFSENTELIQWLCLTEITGLYSRIEMEINI